MIKSSLRKRQLFKIKIYTKNRIRKDPYEKHRIHSERERSFIG